LLFPLRITRTTPPPAWGYRTRVITDGVDPSLHIEYKSSHVKQYFKEQRALRTETTINNPNDFCVAIAGAGLLVAQKPRSGEGRRGPSSRTRGAARLSLLEPKTEDDLRRCDDLADMALRMLGCMEQQAAYRGRELGAAHDARAAKVPLGRPGQLAQRTINDGLPGTKEFLS